MQIQRCKCGHLSTLGLFVLVSVLSVGVSGGLCRSGGWEVSISRLLEWSVLSCNEGSC